MSQLDPVVGHEQGGWRPVLVVSHDLFNHTRRQLVVAVPLTSRLYAASSRVRVEPPEGGVKATSDVLPDQVRTLSHLRLRRRLGRVTPPTLDAVRLTLSAIVDAP